MHSHPFNIIDIGKRVTNKVFGIGITNENFETRLIKIDAIREIREPLEFNGEDRSDKNIYRCHSHVRLNFNE